MAHMVSELPDDVQFLHGPPATVRAEAFAGPGSSMRDELDVRRRWARTFPEHLCASGFPGMRCLRHARAARIAGPWLAAAAFPVLALPAIPAGFIDPLSRSAGIAWRGICHVLGIDRGETGPGVGSLSTGASS